ncbi:MAG: trypsin-like peptidase domain-containing protein [Planctomycetota bacterium]|jgi:serine protease Do
MDVRRVTFLLIIALAAPFAVSAAAPAQTDADRARRRTPVVDVFERTRDAVVNISSKEIVTVRQSFGGGSIFDDFFDLPRRPRTRQYTRQSVGSGFVIHPDGYIVTNAHVIARTAERKVTFADGGVFDAEVIAADPERDIAVLKIDPGGTELPILPLGRSNDLMIGETVIAIGNPLGFQHTVTAGVISATERDLELGPNLSLPSLIQTDASINPGNSGGPLLNVLGELIGVNTAIRPDAQNIGFAIPVDRLREVLPDLIDVERRYRLRSGLAVGNLDEPRVLRVERGSPAAQAGLRVGDVLLAIDGRPVREGIDYNIALIGRRAGDTLRLRVRRDDEQLRVPLRLDARPAPDGTRLARARLGVEVRPLPEDIGRELGLRPNSGLLVVQIVPGGPADEAGMERRDVLISLGRHSVSTVDDLGQLLETADAGDVVPVSVIRVERNGKWRLNGAIRLD